MSASRTFVELYSEGSGLVLGRGRTLFSGQSAFQKVEVFETDAWGRTMTIDGIVMLSERDEFVYHEMLVHVPLMTHPDPRRVLIIGGGDGGSAREVLRHPGVERVDMVEIDAMVVDAARSFMPQVGDFGNPRLNLQIADGIAFLKQVTEPYDVIIIDGSDPVGPAEGLFNRSFYTDCRAALAPGGMLTAQVDSPWLPRFSKTGAALFSMHRELFAVSRPFLSFIPLYPTGMFAMAFASKGTDPLAPESLRRVEARVAAFGHPLRYYNAAVHQASFALPGFVQSLINP